MSGKLPQYAWMNDRLVPWGEAMVHVQTPAFRYGAMVFEGIRGY